VQDGVAGSGANGVAGGRLPFRDDHQVVVAGRDGGLAVFGQESEELVAGLFQPSEGGEGCAGRGGVACGCDAGGHAGFAHVELRFAGGVFEAELP